ncbi:MAG: hypothetical protein Q4D56_06840 [Bacteroides sp.]|nr:hypothetical protein [Bacteroides sp.]
MKIRQGMMCLQIRVPVRINPASEWAYDTHRATLSADPNRVRSYTEWHIIPDGIGNHLG